MKTSVYSSMVLLSSLLCMSLWFMSTRSFAQTDTTIVTADSVSTVISVTDSVTGKTITLPDSIDPAKYVESLMEDDKTMFFQGFTISADLMGPVLYFASDYGSVEGALRLNLKNTYFPIVEVGYAKCDMTDDNTDIHYATTAPYFRVGCDVNMLKDKKQDNRLYIGLRYGFSKFTYDIDGPDISDPIWGGTDKFSYRDLDATCHWAEVIAGVQVKIWKSFHMGWSVRLKRNFSSTQSKYADPYYIPGYGTTTSSTAWGGTYNLIFDLNWGKRKIAKTDR